MPVTASASRQIGPGSPRGRARGGRGARCGRGISPERQAHGGASARDLAIYSANTGGEVPRDARGPAPQPGQIAPYAHAPQARLLTADDRLTGVQPGKNREHRGHMRIGPAKPMIYAPQQPTLTPRNVHVIPLSGTGRTEANQLRREDSRPSEYLVPRLINRREAANPREVAWPRYPAWLGRTGTAANRRNKGPERGAVAASAQADLLISAAPAGPRGRILTHRFPAGRRGFVGRPGLCRLCRFGE